MALTPTDPNADPNATTGTIKPPTLPLAPKPPTTTPDLGQTAQIGGSTLPVGPATQPPAVSDPLAFSGTTDAGYGMPPNAGGPPPGASTPGGSVATATPPAYNPFTPAAQPSGPQTWDDIQGAYRNADGSQVTGAANTATPSAVNAYNFGTAQTDAANNVAALTGAGGVFASPTAQTNYTTGQEALSGYNADGTPDNFGNTATTAGAQAIENQYGGGGAYGTANPLDTGASNVTVNGVNQGTPSTLTTPVSVNGTPVTPGSSVPSSTFGGPASTPPTTPPATSTGSTGVSAAPGVLPVLGGSGTSTGTTGTPGVLPVAGATTGYTPPANGGVKLTPTDPNNPLSAQTISVDPGVNRVAVNDAALNSTIQNVVQPALAANARTVAAESFGAGRGVSGMNRTAEGNLASDTDKQIADLTNQSNANAVTGTIGDAQSAAALAAEQQQNQEGEQQTAFGQNLTAQQLADQESNAAFNQALQQALVGAQGDPAQLELLLSQLTSGQSATNAQAASNLAKSAVS